MKIIRCALFTAVSLIIVQVRSQAICLKPPNNDDRVQQQQQQQQSTTKSLARRQVIRQYPPGTALLADGKPVCGGQDETLYEFVYPPPPPPPAVVDPQPHAEDSKSKIRKHPPRPDFRVYRGRCGGLAFDVRILNSLNIAYSDGYDYGPTNILAANRRDNLPNEELERDEKRPVAHGTATNVGSNDNGKLIDDRNIENKIDPHHSPSDDDDFPVGYNLNVDEHRQMQDRGDANRSIRGKNDQKTVSDRNVKNIFSGSSGVPESSPHRPKYELQIGSGENLEEENKRGTVIMSSKTKKIQKRNGP